MRLWRAKGKHTVLCSADAARAFRALWEKGAAAGDNSFTCARDAEREATRKRLCAEQTYRQRVDEAFIPSAFVTHRHEVRFACFSTCLRRIYSVNREGGIIVWRWRSLDEAKEEFGEDFSEKNCARPVNPGFFSKRKEQQLKARALGDSAGAPETGASGERPSDEFINYAEGLWMMEIKAYCGQEGGQHVTHAATNTSPFFRYSTPNAPPSSSADAEASAVSAETKLPPQYLLIGFTGGAFQLYLLPGLDAIVKLSLGMPALDALALSSDGEWIAAAAAASNTLVVWEWRSETYVLRQQAHGGGVRCVSFSPAADAVGAGSARVGAKAASGGKLQHRAAFGLAEASSFGLGMGGVRSLLATGCGDGRVKVWELNTGFCCCTFADHTAAVTDICFAPNGKAVFSASLDGTVKAYDLLRYKPFR